MRRAGRVLPMGGKRLLVRLAHLVRYALPVVVCTTVVRRRKVARVLPAPRILVTFLESAIGDFLLDVPFLRELRRLYPYSYISLVVACRVEPLARACPYVNEVIGIERSPKVGECGGPFAYLWATVKYLKGLVAFASSNFAGRIDMALQPRWEWESEGGALVTLFSGAARTVAYSEKASAWRRWCHFGQDRLFTDVLQAGEGRHESERTLHVVRYLGGTVAAAAPEVWWSEEDGRRGRRLLDACEPRTLVAFGVGASGARRHWPFFGDLVRLLSRELNFTPVVVAGPGEEHLAAPVVDASPSAIVFQGEPLGVVAAMLSQCALFIGNDSGPMHLAAGAGIPVVEISCHPVNGDCDHANSPERFGPLGPNNAIVRPKGFAGSCRGGCEVDAPHCIASITPGEVAGAAMALLRNAVPLPAVREIEIQR